MSFLDSSRPTPSWKESCYHKTNFKEVEFCHFQIFSRLKELALWFFGRNTFVNKGHLCVMWQPGWEWSLGKNRYMYMYIWVHLLVTWNYHNIVYWLYPNNKQKGYFLSNSLWDSSKSNFPERLFLLAFCAYPIEVTHSDLDLEKSILLRLYIVGVIFIGRTDTEAESPIIWPPDAKSQVIGKDPDAGSNWGQEEKGVTEDEMVGWHHQLNGHEIEQTPGDGEGQGHLMCCSPWGCKESDMTECRWEVNRKQVSNSVLCWVTVMELNRPPYLAKWPNVG